VSLECGDQSPLSFAADSRLIGSGTALPAKAATGRRTPKEVSDGA